MNKCNMVNFYINFQIDETGRMVSVEDRTAHIYELNEIQTGEMVESTSGVKNNMTMLIRDVHATENCNTKINQYK